MFTGVYWTVRKSIALLALEFGVATWKVMGDPRNEYSGVFKMWLELGVIAKSCRNE